jgi:hypothetical protein
MARISSSLSNVLQIQRSASFAGALGFACAAAVLASLPAPARAQAAENPPVQSVCGLDGGETAGTCMYAANAAGLPVSARTEFPDDFDLMANNPDPLNTAEHELFHSIGFTRNYPRFNAKLINTPGRGANGIPAGSQSYSTNGMANGILMVLTPLGQGGNHADPAATGAAPWPATGYNQNMDIMQPNQVVGTRLNANDAAVLNDAFGWMASGIRINVVNIGGTLDGTDLAIINNAVAAVNVFYPVRANSPVFTWSVAEVTVPEPATWATMLLGIGLAGAFIRRRVRIATSA